MASKVAYLVFLIPVAISLPVAAYVLSDVLADPGRELGTGLGASGHAPSPSAGPGAPVIQLLAASYSAGEPLNIRAKINDPVFDCGDVYITIRDADGRPSQQAFFDQCFSESGSIVPVDGQFEKSVSSPGKYELQLQILDSAQSRSASESVVITVGQ